MCYIKKATILVTNTCNFNCAHCFWGNIESKKVISISQLNNILSLCDENGIKKICFSGGEPVLYLDNIVQALNPIKNKFTEISICTNGYWGRTANNICKILKANNITTIELSYDRYHAQYCTEECLKSVVKESQRIGIKVLCVISVANQNEMIKFYKQLGTYFDKNDMIFQYVGPFGNGVFEKTNIPNCKSIKCRQFLTNICVDFNGLVYYCCGPYIANEKGTAFCAGEFTQANLNRLENNSELYDFMSRPFICKEYMCKMCLKRLDKYILSKESVRMQ